MKIPPRNYLHVGAITTLVDILGAAAIPIQDFALRSMSHAWMLHMSILRLDKVLARENYTNLVKTVGSLKGNGILARYSLFDSSRQVFQILTPCIALYDTMQSLKTHIATHCLGQAYNLAAFPWRKDGE
ncbi:ATP-dependent Clp protease proteolytic subunit-related protein 2, chloroplastic [Trifolium repens]|nr:ATP-dependent Clp protease proteolytic subunit-related protein 2, chloroplastic [Trifolium repens]